MKDSQAIKIWNRAENRFEAEQVMGDGWLKWAYATTTGSIVTHALASSGWFSKVFGAWQSTRQSAKRIPGFIRQFSILTDDYEGGPYRSFNEFFIRKFRPGIRVFTAEPAEMPAFAEGRYLAFEQVDEEIRFPVKGQFLDARALLARDGTASLFQNGPMFIARLCPVDYHRFHFPDDGRVEAEYALHGKYDSVNPVALAAKGDVFIRNERFVSILDTAHFGKLAYVEVGALCVGRIVQAHSGGPFRRGEEKGYFLFGGSTVIVLGQKGAWRPDADLLARTREGVETLVKLGTRVASKS